MTRLDELLTKCIAGGIFSLQEAIAIQAAAKVGFAAWDGDDTRQLGTDTRQTLGMLLLPQEKPL